MTWQWIKENPQISVPVGIGINVVLIVVFVLSLITIYNYGRTIVVPPVPVSGYSGQPPSTVTKMVMKNDDKKRDSDAKLKLAYAGVVISGIVIVPEMILLFLLVFFTVTMR